MGRRWPSAPPSLQLLHPQPAHVLEDRGEIPQLPGRAPHVPEQLFAGECTVRVLHAAFTSACAS